MLTLQTHALIVAVVHRDHYKENELLGGSSQTFMVGNMEATRIDFDLVSISQGTCMPQAVFTQLTLALSESAFVI